MDDAKIFEEFRGCKKCELGYMSRSGKVFPRLVRDPKILFVGRSPGSEELVSRNMLDDSTQVGKIFKHYLEYIRIDISEVAYFNMVGCYMPRNKPPSSYSLRACHFWVKVFLERVGDVKIIVPMCEDATRYFLGSVQYKDAINKVFMVGDIKIIPIEHPFIFLRDGFRRDWILEGLDLIRKEL